MNTIIETYSGQSFCGSELDVSKYQTKGTLYEYLVEYLTDEGYTKEEIEHKLSGEELEKDLYGFNPVDEFDEECSCECEQGVITYVWIEGK
jgi:hypothetical protein